MERLATIFVEWEPIPYDQAAQSRAAQLRASINSKQNLSRNDKDFITKNANENCYFKDSIPVGGWRFNFSDILRRYLVNFYGQWHEYRACDKTALRKMLGRSAKEIQEIPGRA